MNHSNKPKSFVEELRRQPIDYQRRVIWTFRIAAAWLATTLVGAGAFILSKPYMDRKRKERLESGEFFRELKEKEDKFPIKAKRTFGTSTQQNSASSEIAPPGYLLEVISDILDEDKVVTVKENVEVKEKIVI